MLPKRRLNKDEIKEQLISPLIVSEKIESANLDEVTSRVENFEDAAATIREYEEIIRTKKTNIRIAYQ